MSSIRIALQYDERSEGNANGGLPATADQICDVLVSRLAGLDAFLTAIVFGAPVVEMEGRVTAWLERGVA